MTHGTYSVVIPTLNAEAEIGGLLGIVLNQHPAPLEVLVVDSSSDDRTAEIVQSYQGVRLEVIDRSAFDHGKTRDDALRMTSGEFCCFLTQDAVPLGDRCFERLLAPFENPSVAMSSGRQLPRPQARPFERHVRSYSYPAESFVRGAEDVVRLGIRAYLASDVFAAYRRSAYLEVGGFERCSTNEDMLMAARFINAGMLVAYAADAEVVHSHNLTPRQQFARNRAVGAFLEQHQDEFGQSSEVGEGLSLVKHVSGALLRERRPLELAAFGVDCAARLAGNRCGRLRARRGRKGRDA